MRKLFSLFLLISISFSCQDINRSPKPENLIPEDKMVEVLTEISLLHGARSYNKGLMEEKGIDAYPYLMDKFGIDSVQLVQSNNYYAENYKQYQRIYNKVKSRLEVLMKKYDSIREVEEKRQDSIRDLIKSDTLSKSEVDSLLQDTIRSLPEPVFRGRERRIFEDTIR
jgi:hypothetical protein